MLDNGSSDGTVDWLERVHPEVRVVRSARNLGFCRGYNLLARSTAGEFLVLLNDDTRPDAGLAAESGRGDRLGAGRRRGDLGLDPRLGRRAGSTSRAAC